MRCCVVIFACGIKSKATLVLERAALRSGADPVVNDKHDGEDGQEQLRQLLNPDVDELATLVLLLLLPVHLVGRDPTHLGAVVLPLDDAVVGLVRLLGHVGVDHLQQHVEQEDGEAGHEAEEEPNVDELEAGSPWEGS